MKLIARATVATTLAMFAGTAAFAQDAVKVDPKHYTVLVDNAQVRVLKIHYGPHETSVMHSHPNSVITYLSDANNSFLLAHGKTIKDVAKAGTAAWAPGGAHKPTNLSGKPMDAILVELKGGKGK
jgi:hypothetical protein